VTVLEPDVTFTDYGLAVECAVLAALARGAVRNRRLQPWCILFFLSLGLAALAGGTVHGFFPDEQSPGFRILWPLALLAVGATAVSAWAIGAHVLFHETGATRIIAAAWMVFSIYAMVVLAGVQTFAVAIAHYAPSALFLLAAFAVRYAKTRIPQAGIGAAAVGVMLAAAVVQRAGVALHPAYFDHNALYHLLQAVALILFYLATRSPMDASTHGG
jgi:hypothetical protein